MNSTESFSHENIPATEGQAVDIELMAIHDVIEQSDIDLLKSQLAAAHQLLQYRQTVIHALTEQIHLKDTHLLHAERQVESLQQTSQSQTIELAEMRAICADLRSQLKRQTRRPTQAQQSRCTPSARPLGFEIQTPRPARAAISFGYESTEGPTETAHHLTKAPPVQAWSASQNGAGREGTTFCHKLSTLIVSPASSPTPVKLEPVPEKVHQPVSPGARGLKKRSQSQCSVSHPSVNLPQFALG